jgi:hypothetical protein
LLIAHLRIGSVAPGERNANAADYRDTPRSSSHQHTSILQMLCNGNSEATDYELSYQLIIDS